MAKSNSPITFSKQLNTVPGDNGVKIALVLGFSLALLTGKDYFRERSSYVAVGILGVLASIFFFIYVSLLTDLR